MYIYDLQCIGVGSINALDLHDRLAAKSGFQIPFRIRTGHVQWPVMDNYDGELHKVPSRGFELASVNHD